jgi:hypothetical protein
LVAIAAGHGDVGAGTDRCFDGFADGDFSTGGVETADGEAQTIVEQGAFEAVIVALGGLGFIIGERDRRGGIGLRDKIAFAVIGEEA